MSSGAGSLSSLTVSPVARAMEMSLRWSPDEWMMQLLTTSSCSWFAMSARGDGGGSSLKYLSGGPSVMTLWISWQRQVLCQEGLQTWTTWCGSFRCILCLCHDEWQWDRQVSPLVPCWRTCCQFLLIIRSWWGLHSNKHPGITLALSALVPWWMSLSTWYIHRLNTMLTPTALVITKKLSEQPRRWNNDPALHHIYLKKCWVNLPAHGNKILDKILNQVVHLVWHA